MSFTKTSATYRGIEFVEKVHAGNELHCVLVSDDDCSSINAPRSSRTTMLQVDGEGGNARTLSSDEEDDNQEPLDASEDDDDISASNISVGSSINIVPRRFACKARGLDQLLHNDKTAYIDVPEGAKHGEIIMCSNDDCNKSGRRFRYCVVCKQPVAKRNFSMRHSHGLPVTFFRGAPCWAVPVDQHNLLNEDNDSSLKRKSAPTASTSDQETLPKRIYTSREKRWLHLLHERPSIHDSVAMAKWMSAVVETTEGSVSRIPHGIDGRVVDAASKSLPCLTDTKGPTSVPYCYKGPLTRAELCINHSHSSRRNSLVGAGTLEGFTVVEFAAEELDSIFD